MSVYTVSLIVEDALIALDCRVFRLKNGEVGIRAIKPVIVDGKVIKLEKPLVVDGKCVANRGILMLKTDSTIALCGEDMNIVAEYTLKIGA